MPPNVSFCVLGSPPRASPLCLGCSTKPCSASIKWLGLSFSTSLSSTCSAITSSVLKRMWVGYAKISPKRGRYSRKGLCRLHSSFCAPAVFYLSGFAVLLRKKNKKKIRSGYFKYCKYLLRLPWCIGIIQSFLNLASLMRPRYWNIYLKIYLLKLGNWLVFLTLFGHFLNWGNLLMLYAVMLFMLLCFFLFFFFFVCLLHSLIYFVGYK